MTCSVVLLERRQGVVLIRNFLKISSRGFRGSHSLLEIPVLIALTTKVFVLLSKLKILVIVVSVVLVVSRVKTNRPIPKQPPSINSSTFQTRICKEGTFEQPHLARGREFSEYDMHRHVSERHREGRREGVELLKDLHTGTGLKPPAPS